MVNLRRFLRDDTGAINVDWVTLTAGVIVVGIVVVFAVYNAGVAPLVVEVNASVLADLDAPEKGKGVDCNTFTSC